MTDAEFIAWLKHPTSIRVVLVEVGVSVAGVETTYYLSDRGYVTEAGDTPANTTYVPAITGDIEYYERLSLDGSPTVSLGDIEVMNVGGERDAWLGADHIWRNRAVRVYLGDVRWPRADFRLMVDGLIANLGGRTSQRLNFAIRDKMARLNTAVTEAKLGGSTSNKDRLLPITIGEAHNVEPLLTNPATLEYQVHNGAIERIIEVRDNGVPASHTASLSTGKFTLAAARKGQITASVQGDKPSTYSNTVAALIQRLATGYGNDPLSPSDIDSANFTAFAAANPQPVGLYLADRENVLECCQRLAASVGAQLLMTALGQLRLVKIELPAPGTATVVRAANMRRNTLYVSERVPVVASVKVGFCRNWTKQQGLQTGIPDEHKDLYGQEWLTRTASDPDVAADYKLPQVPPEQQDTALLVGTDAQAEVDRRLALWSVPRVVYSFQAFPELMLQPLGGAMTIIHSRFQASGGLTGQVVGVRRGFISGKVSVEMLA